MILWIKSVKVASGKKRAKLMKGREITAVVSKRVKSNAIEPVSKT